MFESVGCRERLCTAPDTVLFGVMFCWLSLLRMPFGPVDPVERLGRDRGGKDGKDGTDNQKSEGRNPNRGVIPGRANRVRLWSRFGRSRARK